MAVPEEFRGQYRQIADTLRWRRAGVRMESERPIDEANTRYIDSLEKPTIVRFEADDKGVDVEMLLRQGAIARLEPRGKQKAEEPKVMAEERGG